MRNSGTLRFSYEGDVLKWSNTDFSFSFTVINSLPGALNLCFQLLQGLYLYVLVVGLFK